MASLKSRFCYNYTRPGNITHNCVQSLNATNDYESISKLSRVVNNSSRTTERSLLLQSQQQFLQGVYSTAVSSTLQNTLENISSINNTIYGQLLQLGQQRYTPYQPYVYPCVPPSVIQLQMNTVNVGVPQSFVTILDCKGSQSVTT